MSITLTTRSPHRPRLGPATKRKAVLARATLSALAFAVVSVAGMVSRSGAVRAESPPADASSHAAALADVKEPTGYRDDHYRSPVPKKLQGARVVDAEGAEALVKAEQAILIDVYPQAPKPAGLPASTIWRRPKHMSIAGAVWLPNVGYGKLAAAPEAYFRTNLERLTGGAKDKPLVFFCLRDCWMSWNAAKRALAWGFTNVVWFPDGTDGWQEIGGKLVDAIPAPGTDGRIAD